MCLQDRMTIAITCLTSHLPRLKRSRHWAFPCLQACASWHKGLSFLPKFMSPRTGAQGGTVSSFAFPPGGRQAGRASAQYGIRSSPIAPSREAVTIVSVVLCAEMKRRVKRQMDIVDASEASVSSCRAPFLQLRRPRGFGAEEGQAMPEPKQTKEQ